ncbi:hypothetical protein [Limimaricola pyoseonensis]|uniref:EF-hand domain-containing protein n=1 Tax=Limimaricola pyoseonensis TaxID=521013 RepID=A0A1G7IE48_9RHOB|nr:hypothetical protein [Limimaricola pyoseonensis]SDF11007.1 hypothetical protein SAMN04488567_3431 [Limimaricola pyoseonensis]
MLKKLSTAAATTAFVLSASTALAQAIPFAEVDTDGDMMLTNDELVAAFGEEGAAILIMDDTDGDGMLSVAEIRMSADMGDDVDSPEDRAESDDSEDPDYRDDGEEAVDPNTIDETGTGNEEDDSGGAGDDDDAQN